MTWHKLLISLFLCARDLYLRPFNNLKVYSDTCNSHELRILLAKFCYFFGLWFFFSMLMLKKKTLIVFHKTIMDLYAWACPIDYNEAALQIWMQCNAQRAQSNQISSPSKSDEDQVNKLMDSSGKWTAALPANKLLVFVMFMTQVNTHSWAYTCIDRERVKFHLVCWNLSMWITIVA